MRSSHKTKRISTIYKDRKSCASFNGDFKKELKIEEQLKFEDTGTD